jgi:hypothetical protein
MSPAKPQAKPFWKTRTFWGTLGAAVVHVVAAPDNTARIQAGIEGAGIVLGAIGLRDAVSKNGAGH